MSTQPTTPGAITANAIASFDGCGDPRLRELLQSLTRHLHAFAVDVGLTHDEWLQAIGLLTATGHITDERRQEFILWSDALGLSMLVDALANPLPPNATESTVLGPFYVPGAPLREYGANLAEVEAGTPAWVHGRILSTTARRSPAPSSTSGRTATTASMPCRIPTPPTTTCAAGSGRATTARSRFSRCGRRRTRSPTTARWGRCCTPPAAIRGVRRTSTSSPARRPPHLATHIFDAASDYLDSDAVFAVKPSLLRTFESHAAGDPGAPPGVAGPWFSVECDIVLAPGADAREPSDPGRTA